MLDECKVATGQSQKVERGRYLDWRARLEGPTGEEQRRVWLVLGERWNRRRSSVATALSARLDANLIAARRMLFARMLLLCFDGFGMELIRGGAAVGCVSWLGTEEEDGQ